jgi:Yip1 domain
MSVVGSTRSQGLVARAIGILSRPKAEWDVIATETATTQGLILGYAAILAALPAIARGVHGLMPQCAFGICYTPNPAFAIGGAIAWYVISVAGVFVVGLIIDALAPNFGGEKNPVQAMKVAVYSWTAAWIAGIFVIIPWVGGLFGLLGLYSLYLLYAGIPKLMKAPEDRSLGYTVVVIVLAILVFLVGAAIAGAVGGMGMIGSNLANPGGQISGTLNVHDGANNASVDLGRLQAAAQQFANQAKAQEHDGPGKIVAIDPDKLKSFLPDNVGGAPRTEIQAVSAGGAGVADAEATYSNNDVHVTVKVTDLGVAGGVTAFATALNVQSDKQTATGYERVTTINGRLTKESYDNQAKSGDYSVIVANRFSIEAQGSGVPIDTLKAAVNAVGPDRLQGLAHG